MNGVSFYKPNLPDLEVYNSYVKNIWDEQVLTNNGPYVQLLETKLREYLKVEHVILVSNGTLALQIAIQALGMKGNILTSPFSFIASSSSLLWEKCIPQYADIDPITLNINLSNENWTGINGILPVQIFGFPYDDTFNKRDLPVLIDGAQSFGVFENGKSILNKGDISIVSFHATKFFHTVEGGAVITNNQVMADKVKSLRNFGWNEDRTDTINVGINTKMSEFHAAMGLSLFEHIDTLKSRNKYIYECYTSALLGKCDLAYIPETIKNLDYHYAYFPVIFNTPSICERFMELCNQKGIGYKKYFDNPLNKLRFVGYKACPNCEDICRRVLTIPLYASMTESEIQYVVKAIKSL